MSEFKLYCDMDGVLCNFNKGFQDLNDEGLTFDQYEEKHGKIFHKNRAFLVQI